MDATQNVDAETRTDTPTEESNAALPIRTNPTIRPTAVWLGLVVVAGLVAIGYVVANPDAFGDPETANVVANALLLLTLVGAIRFCIRIYVLRQTEYVVNDATITRSYSLLYRSFTREVPIEKIRSSELRRSRIQTLLGYGTISVNQGLGTLELENVPSPNYVQESISRQAERGHE